jgi:chromosome segregation ATPase
MSAKNQAEIMNAFAQLNANFEKKFNELNEQYIELNKKFSQSPKNTSEKTEEISEVSLLEKEIEKINSNTKMKPDNKAKKLEKLEKKLEKLQNRIEKKSENKESKEQPNLSKMSASNTSTLKEVLGDDFVASGKGVPKNTTSVEMFKSYVNSMDPENYPLFKIEDHMQNFKNTLKLNSQETRVHGGALKVLTLDELSKLENELVHTDQIGEYKTKDGMLVTGPSRNEDQEDLDTKEFDGEEFDVDKYSARVYDIDSAEFKGYWRTTGGLI